MDDGVSQVADPTKDVNLRQDIFCLLKDGYHHHNDYHWRPGDDMRNQQGAKHFHELRLLLVVVGAVGFPLFPATVGLSTNEVPLEKLQDNLHRPDVGNDQSNDGDQVLNDNENDVKEVVPACESGDTEPKKAVELDFAKAKRWRYGDKQSQTPDGYHYSNCSARGRNGLVLEREGEENESVDRQHGERVDGNCYQRHENHA